MEQPSQYLMWMKSKDILNFHFQADHMNPIFNNSWEEQAFADDAAGPLGGFIWPPRSYSCSFCKREFRSAQALGGHMNVHRRDRAKLKQLSSLSPQNELLLLHDHQNHTHHKSCKSFDNNNPYPSQVCFLNSNLDDDPKANPSFLSSRHHSSSRVSAISTQENFSDQHKTFLSPFSSSSLVQEQIKETFEKNARKEEFSFLDHDGDCVETNLSMGLNLVTSQNQTLGWTDDDHEVNNITCKKHKTTVSSMPFLLKTRTLEEDLDLELRLGDPPKVK